MPTLFAAASLVLVSACAGIPGPVEDLTGDPLELQRLTEARFFLQMSDTQLGFARTPLVVQLAGYSWGDDPTGEELALFERAIEHANRLRPAFVVICGDLINRPGHAGQAEAFQRIAARLDASIPLHLVSGNHDVENRPSAESLRWYRETFGPDWYAFRHGDVHGIVLNSSLIHDPGSAPDDAEAQLAWLREELERASGAPHVVVFQHHSYFLNDPEEEDAYFNLPLERRRSYLELLRSGGVGAVFAGHYHRNGHGRFGALEMVTTGPVGKPLGDDPSGFRIVRVGPDGLEHGYFGIAEPR